MAARIDLEPGAHVRASLGDGEPIEGVVRASGQYAVPVEWVEITRADGSVTRVEAVGPTVTDPLPLPLHIESIDG